MSPNQAQSEAWNGEEATHYIANADRYDCQLAAFTKVLMNHARIEPTDRVLDIGCGCGATTLQAALRARAVLAADISDPMVRIATDRAEAEALHNVSFMVADAQTHPFGEDAFDVLISRFGLMFFDDPEGAFANLHKALAPGGRAAFITWRSLEANEWLMMVGEAAARYIDVPNLGGRAGGPGMFALAKPDELTALLSGVGFTQVAVEPVTTTILLAGGGTLDESLDFLLGMGMVRGLLGPLDNRARDAAIGDIRVALGERHEPGIGVRLGAAGWLATAHR